MVSFSKKAKDVTFFPDLQLKITRPQTTDVSITSWWRDDDDALTESSNYYNKSSKSYCHYLYFLELFCVKTFNVKIAII